MFYSFFLKKILFLFNPESAHNLIVRLIKFFFLFPPIRQLCNAMYCVKDIRLQKKIFGIVFENPVGLAAGFDKNANLIDEMSSFGFGFIEVGTVTPKPQKGNSQPRLFRLEEDHALINRMGFNNDGIEDVIKSLRKRKSNIIIGGNIGKNKTTPNNLAYIDYKICFELIAPHVDYVVLNVSSPNTPNLRQLQNKLDLQIILSTIQQINNEKYNKPVLIKISPELTKSQVDEIIDLVNEFSISGLIATNTSNKRHNLYTSKEKLKYIGNGGLSGRPLFSKSKELVSYIYKKSKGTIPIIAVGGIMTPADAKVLLSSGASLVQVYTGFIYKGPNLIKKINQSLIQD